MPRTERRTVLPSSQDGLSLRKRQRRINAGSLVDQAGPGLELNKSAAADKNYLFDAVIAQIHSGPLRWHLMITVGQPGDPTAQASTQWPADRKQIDVGSITIDSIESEDTSSTRNITLDPLVLPDGISP